MNVFPTTTDRRPEAMADVPGVCELPLTRAVVQYRDIHETGTPGGRIQDIGLGLVLEGRYASASEVVDLGSADVKVLDLSAELVVLDWAYDPTLEHAHDLVREAARTGRREALRRFCFDVALRVLRRTGFGPLTRTTLLRLGFRDICRDLDLHEGTSVRLSPGPGRRVRIHLDYDANALLVRTGGMGSDEELEEALAVAFPSAELRRRSDAARPGPDYELRFALPLDLGELREEMAEIRDGLSALLSRFEPRRFAATEALVSTFGERETLARLEISGGIPGSSTPVPRRWGRADPVERAPYGDPSPASRTVH